MEKEDERNKAQKEFLQNVREHNALHPDDSKVNTALLGNADLLKNSELLHSVSIQTLDTEFADRIAKCNKNEEQRQKKKIQLMINQAKKMGVMKNYHLEFLKHNPSEIATKLN